VGPFRRDVRALQHRADALDVGAQRLPRAVLEPFGLVDLARRRGDDGVDLCRARGGRRELARVEVEEDGEDLPAVRAQLGQAAQAPARDRVGCHGIPLPGCPLGEPVARLGRTVRGSEKRNVPA
jgi:hypothetical protein